MLPTNILLSVGVSVSTSRSNNYEKVISRRLKEAESVETLRVIILEEELPLHLFKEQKALKVFLLLEFTVYFMCLLSMI